MVSNAIHDQEITIELIFLDCPVEVVLFACGEDRLGDVCLVSVLNREQCPRHEGTGRSAILVLGDESGADGFKRFQGEVETQAAIIILDGEVKDLAIFSDVNRT